MDRLSGEMSVGELAERSGVAVSALHFYERQGLIASRRTAGNQRETDALSQEKNDWKFSPWSLNAGRPPGANRFSVDMSAPSPMPIGKTTSFLPLASC